MAGKQSASITELGIRQSVIPKLIKIKLLSSALNGQRSGVGEALCTLSSVKVEFHKWGIFVPLYF